MLYCIGTVVFFAIYVGPCSPQVGLLLYFCHIIVHWMWKRGIDPDNSAIPYLTALGDLLGTSFLALAFLLLNAFGYDHEAGSSTVAAN
jgi:solute carrier family 41